MNAHAHRPLAGRHANPSSLGKLAAWVNARWQARRARRLEEETVVCLSTLDAKLINDIGVDIDRLSELTPRMRDAANQNDPSPSEESSQDKRS